MDFETVYLNFLNTLEEIAETHDELTDTDVRERLRVTINYYFVWNNALDATFPQKYAMFSAEGDALIAQATRTFIEQAQQATVHVAVGNPRNDLLENSDVETTQGESFDAFIGSTDEALEEEAPDSDAVYGDYDE
jgi:hypothetical protein